MHKFSNRFSLAGILFVFLMLSSWCLDNVYAAPWKQIVDFGDKGYSETGNAWKNYISDQAHNSSYRYLSHFDEGRPRRGTATWQITIPNDGWYEVAVSFRRTPNRSPDANYFATNNSGGLDETIISQAGPLALIWHTLGTYHYTAGQSVKVFLDGTDDDYSDCADAASWTLVPTPSGNGLNSVLSLLLSPPRVSITVTKDGTGSGTILSSPGGMNCGTVCSFPFVQDRNIDLIAVPDRGSVFGFWTGDVCSGSVETCSIYTDVEKTINATFDPLPQHNLAVIITGTGTGSVTSSPISADGTDFICSAGSCTKPFYKDEVVTLTATEDRSSQLAGWSDDCSATGLLEATVNMGTANKTCTAAFSPKPQHVLTVSINGTGTGEVTSSPASADGNPIFCSNSVTATCSKSYWQDDIVTLTPSADLGSQFIGWIGDADCSDGIVTMDGAKNCTATFDIGAPTQHTLTVQNGSCGDGSYGTITSNPVGINCQGTDSLGVVECSADFDENKIVTLTANTTAGNFAGWTGDCTATAEQTVVTATMDAAKTCIAAFCSLSL